MDKKSFEHNGKEYEVVSFGCIRIVAVANRSVTGKPRERIEWAAFIGCSDCLGANWSEEWVV